MMDRPSRYRNRTMTTMTSGQTKSHTRTHMLMGNKQHKVIRKVKRPVNKLHQPGHEKKEKIRQWKGNQRLTHFGPLAYRDPYYYYYPDGWNKLYPAYFGYFPYRTRKFRGSSAPVCLSAFGTFFLLGGISMLYLGYFHPNRPPPLHWLSLSPLQIGAPFLLSLGFIFLLTGCCWWFSAMNFFSENLTYIHKDQRQPTMTIIRNLEEEVCRTSCRSPYELPAPPYRPCQTTLTDVKNTTI